MATASVSKPWAWYFWWVVTKSGISATQVVQLVAQKLTNTTLPRKSALRRVEPSSSTKVEAGAGDTPVPKTTQVPKPATAAKASAIAPYFIRISPSEKCCSRRLCDSCSRAAIMSRKQPYTL